jgi:hypothetical protein
MRLGTKVESNSRIQFASNQSKLAPRKLDPEPLSKVGLNDFPMYSYNYAHSSPTVITPM